MAAPVGGRAREVVRVGTERTRPVCSAVAGAGVADRPGHGLSVVCDEHSVLSCHRAEYLRHRPHGLALEVHFL